MRILTLFLMRLIRSNINNELKEILIDRIEDILLIIRKYKIHGTNELIKSLETSIGSICTNQTNIKKQKRKLVFAKIFFQNYQNPLHV